MINRFSLNKCSVSCGPELHYPCSVVQKHVVKKGSVQTECVCSDRPVLQKMPVGDNDIRQAPIHANYGCLLF